MLAAACVLLVSCGRPSVFDDSEEYPSVFPDYVGVTVPETMARLTFRMADGRRFKSLRLAFARHFAVGGEFAHLGLDRFQPDEAVQFCHRIDK